MRELPLVSVVTPSLNQGRFLRRALDSVLSQDYARIEHIVVDGGSSDQSLSILRSYGERVFWLSEPDRGQAHAINKGLLLARGDILAFLNSDDALAPGAVGRVVNHFRDNPACEVVYGQAYIVDEADHILGRYPTAPFDADRLRDECFICQPATFWRREAMDRFGVLDEALRFALDYDYWLRLAQGGARFEHLPEVLACSRSYAETKTLAHRMDVLREILAVARRHGGAGPAQYQAYWHHRCHERRTGWARWLRWLPAIERRLARLHCGWDRCAGRVAALFCGWMRGTLSRPGSANRGHDKRS
jgi:glycosyltransferase involved in cell wall biosynthesis